MKNKKLLFLAAFIFLSGMFFLNSENVFAVAGDCTRAGGVCTGAMSCRSPKIPAITNSAECTGRYFSNNACCKDPVGGGVLQDTCSPAGGECSASCDVLGKITDASKTCAMASYECCVDAPAGEDTCSGTCRDACLSIEDPVGSASLEKCAIATQKCCKPKSLVDNACAATSGNSCKGTPCSTLANMEDAIGDCSAGQYCCKDLSAGGGGGSGSGSGSESATGGAMWNVESLAGFGLPDATISGIIENLVRWLLYIFGFLGIIAFVISGIFYLTAAGDADQEKKAKLAMKMGIFGIVVGLVGLVAIQAIDLLLRAGGSGVYGG